MIEGFPGLADGARPVDSAGRIQRQADPHRDFPLGKREAELRREEGAVQQGEGVFSCH